MTSLENESEVMLPQLEMESQVILLNSAVVKKTRNVLQKGQHSLLGQRGKNLSFTTSRTLDSRTLEQL